MAQATALKDVSTNDIEQQLTALKADVAGLTKALADYGQAQSKSLSVAASNGVEVAKSKTEAAAHLAAVKAEEAYVAAREKAGVAYAKSEEAVRQNPAAAVGMAAGLGFLVGLMTARR